MRTLLLLRHQSFVTHAGEIQSRRHGDDTADSLPRHLHIGAQAFCISDKTFRKLPVDTRHADGDVGDQRISAIHRITTERDFDGHGGVANIDPLALREQAQRAVKARGVAGGKELFGIGPAARTTELGRQPQIEGETAVVGARDARSTAVPGFASGDGDRRRIEGANSRPRYLSSSVSGGGCNLSFSILLPVCNRRTRTFRILRIRMVRGTSTHIGARGLALPAS